MLTNELNLVARLIERFLDVQYLPATPHIGIMLAFRCEYWDENLRDALHDFLSDYGVFLFRCNFEDNILYVVPEATLEYNTKKLYGGSVVAYPKLVMAVYDIEYVLDLIDKVFRTASIRDFTLSIYYHAIMITVPVEELDSLLAALSSVDIGTPLISESYGLSVVEISFDDGRFATVGAG